MATDKAFIERQQYVDAFNDTMVKIWKEKIIMLDVIRTGALYNSVASVKKVTDQNYTTINLGWGFNEYGLYVNYGTGSNTWRGNPGDIGRDNLRKRKNWFSKKYYASVMNLQEFYADNLGKEYCYVLSNALSNKPGLNNLLS